MTIDSLRIIRDRALLLPWTAELLAILATLAAFDGAYTRAARLLGAQTSVSERMGLTVVHDVITDLYGPGNQRQDPFPTARAALGEAQWQSAYAAGQALSTDDAINEALSAPAT